MPNPTTQASISALQEYNRDYSTAWTIWSNWTSVSTGFETYINKYLFPKLNETAILNVALGNRFEWLAKEIDFIGQYSEEYVILDTVPINMNLSKSEELIWIYLSYSSRELNDSMTINESSRDEYESKIHSIGGTE